MKILVIAAVLISSQAWAHIPPSNYLIKTVIKKKSGFKGVRVRSLISAMTGDHVSGVHFKQITWVESATGMLRSRAYDDSGKELYATERKIDETLRDALLFSEKASDVEQLLKQAHIPVKTEAELLALPDEDARTKAETTWLSRIKSSVAWVIGPLGPQAAPELWIEKDTFLPVRVFFESPSGLADVHFENYRYFHEFPFPRQITAVKAAEKITDSLDGAILREDVSEVQVNGDLSEFKKMPFSSGFTDLGNSVDSALRDLVRKYYELLR